MRLVAASTPCVPVRAYREDGDGSRRDACLNRPAGLTVPPNKEGQSCPPRSRPRTLPDTPAPIPQCQHQFHRFWRRASICLPTRFENYGRFCTVT